MKSGKFNEKKIFELIEYLSVSKSIPVENITKNLIFAIEKAYLKEFPDVNISINIDNNEKKLNFCEEKIVVEDEKNDIDDDKEITISEAQKLNKRLKVGSIFSRKINISELERRIIIHIKQIFEQKMAEEYNKLVYGDWHKKVGTIIRATVENDNGKYIEVDLEKTKGVVLKSDQIKGEKLKPGEKYYFYIKEVKEQTKGWPIILSRSCDEFVINMLKNEVPEISQGIVEIKNIARIPGVRTKIAVYSNDPNVDPSGACIGHYGSKINNVRDAIGGELIDIINWSSDIKQLLVNACSPAKLIGIEIIDDDDNKDYKHITLVASDDNLPKIIGKGGTNIKLISKLNNWSINAISLSIALEDKIEYEDVSKLISDKHKEKTIFSNSFNRNRSNPRKEKSSNQEDFNFKLSNNEVILEKPTFDVTDDDIDEIINFNSAPKKSIEIKRNITTDIDDIFLEDDNKNNLSNSNNLGPKYKKSKKRNRNKLQEEIFENFDDITEDILEEEKDIEYSDNLEIDEE